MSQSRRRRASYCARCRRTTPWSSVGCTSRPTSRARRPSHRRLGVASALLTRAVSVTSSPLALRVAPTNTAAHTLYERLGSQEG
ncbi:MULTISPECIES: GNAT family N-acetyltransferase [unclassified Kribbella]|uniref:GNAT family N-acetyltransferase n=1 Tax=unclassified Kribbella TaxID=2644121 RepID=UPI0033CEBC90